MIHRITIFVVGCLLLPAAGRIGQAQDTAQTADAKPQAVLKGITRLMDEQIQEAVNVIKSNDLQEFTHCYGEIVSTYGLFVNEASRAATSLGEAKARAEQVRIEFAATPDLSKDQEATQKAEATQLSERRLALLEQLRKAKSEVEQAESQPAKAAALADLKTVVGNLNSLDAYLLELIGAGHAGELADLRELTSVNADSVKDRLATETETFLLHTQLMRSRIDRSLATLANAMQYMMVSREVPSNVLDELVDLRGEVVRIAKPVDELEAQSVETARRVVNANAEMEISDAEALVSQAATILEQADRKPPRDACKTTVIGGRARCR